jgi:hypothetical protein
MPDFSKTLNVSQGFNFKKDMQSRVGFLTALTLGTQDLEKDILTIKDPLNPTKDIDGGVVAVLNYFSWSTERTGTVQISGQISANNRQKIAEMLLGTLTDTTVKFAFNICEYELGTKKYFKSAFTGKDLLQGLIEKNGDDLSIAVADDPSTEVMVPRNYLFTLSIKPQSIDQEIYLAVGETRKKASAWGVKESKAA